MAGINPGINSLISWWALNEASGNALDSHGSNVLTETSGTIDSAVGKVNGARDIELGDTEYFNIADNASLSFGDEDMTIGGWFKPESVNIQQMIIGKYNSTADKREYGVYCPATDLDSLRFSVGTGTGATKTDVTSAVNMSNGSWYFFIAWHDKTANTINISVNQEVTVSTAHTTGVLDLTQPFTIGAQAEPMNYADGLVDECFIYRRLLTADEREWLWNGGNGRSYAELHGGGPSMIVCNTEGCVI